MENSKMEKINKFKKNWIVKRSKTAILIILILGVFIGINILMNNLELSPLDFTKEGLFTLTDESKERISSIEKDVNIFFVGYPEENAYVELAKEYNKANEKIIVEIVNETSRPDILQKYELDLSSTGIIIESGEKSKVLSEYDLLTYDSVTGQTINISEEVFTSSIISITTENVPNVYFLEGYSDFSLNENMMYLGMYLQNEISEINTLSILSEGKVPEDCDVLVIPTPNKDFDDVAYTEIVKYINAGGNILWMNGAIAYPIEEEFTNVNKILELYAINPFEYGLIREVDSTKMVAGSQDVIFPSVIQSDVTNNSPEIILVNATKIDVADDKLEEQKVQRYDLLESSSEAYFRVDLMGISDTGAAEGEEIGPFLIGAEMVKTISEETETTAKIESTLIIIGENYFISDYAIMQNSQYPGVQLSYNRNIVLDSIAYLSEREEDIAARKTTGESIITFEPTQVQNIIIQIIIFGVPVIILITGIVVWNVRRRKGNKTK